MTWAEQRGRAVAAHAAALRRAREVEAKKAQAVVDEFVRQALRRGLPVTPLVARGFGGRGRYRTGLRGWYVVPDRSAAVTVEGGFYLLSVPPSTLGRITGVTVAPQQPRLVYGEGGRDGESIPLQTLLQRRLDGGPDWS